MDDEFLHRFRDLLQSDRAAAWAVLREEVALMALTVPDRDEELEQDLLSALALAHLLNILIEKGIRL